MFHNKTYSKYKRCIAMYAHTHRVLPATVVGLLLGIGFVYPVVWYLSLLGFVGLLWILKQSASSRSAFVSGWVSVSILTACSLSWALSIYPVDWWSELSGGWQIVILVTYWLTSALVIGISGGIFAVSAWYLAKYTSYYLVCVPFLWVAREVIGSLLLSVFVLGPGSDINIKFSYGYLGYLLAESDLFLPIAQWGGVYALSLAFSVVAVFLYWWYTVSRSRFERVLSVVCVFFIIFSGSIVSPYKSSNTDLVYEKNLEVLVVETNFSREEIGAQERGDIQPLLLYKLFRDIDTSNLDYIVLPEGSEFISGYKNNTIARYQLNNLFSADSSLVLVDTGAVDTQSGEVLRAHLYDTDSDTFSYADKSYLVGQGEYLSYLPGIILETILPQDTFQTLQDRFPYVASDQSVMRSEASAKVPVLFCYSSADPQKVHNLVEVNGTVDFVAHVISHGWFNNPEVLWQQQDTMLKVQAVWNQVSIISVANEATSKIYTPAGNIYTVEDVAHTMYEHVPHAKAMQIRL